MDTIKLILLNKNSTECAVILYITSHGAPAPAPARGSRKRKGRERQGAETAVYMLQDR